VLGSDVLPDLNHLHTIKLIPSAECVKREQQFRYPYHGPGHYHHHHHHGSQWWPGGGLGGPPPPPHAPPAPGPSTGLVAPGPSPTNLSNLDMNDMLHDHGDLYDFEEEYLFNIPGLSDDLNLQLATNNSIAAASTSTMQTNNGAGSAASSSRLSPMSVDQDDATSPSPAAGPSTGNMWVSSGGTSTSTSTGMSTATSPAGAGMNSSSNPRLYTHYFGNRQHQIPLSAITAAYAAALADPLHVPPPRPHNPPPPPPAVEPPARRQNDVDEQRRIAQSLEEDLQDYLVGWNRHCPSLRVVQMERGWYWMRRFDGDVWSRMRAA